MMKRGVGLDSKIKNGTTGIKSVYPVHLLMSFPKWLPMYSTLKVCLGGLDVCLEQKHAHSTKMADTMEPTSVIIRSLTKREQNASLIST